MAPYARPLMLLAALGLGACNKVNFDADVAADPIGGATRVTLPLDGVVLQKDDGSTITVSGKDSFDVDLTQFNTGATYSLLSGFEIDDATYTGAQLQINASGGELVSNTGGSFPIDVAADTRFAAVSFKARKGDNEAITLALDLRLSLALKSTQRYTLNPQLRAVRGSGATLSGTVASTLLPAATCNNGAAVYLYAGTVSSAKERDGTAGDPIATAPVLSGSYTLRYLPEGDYSLALTCDGEFEAGLDGASSPMSFTTPVTTSLSEGQSRTLNLR